METRPVPPRRLWLLALGFGLWCTALVVVYSMHAMGCAFGWRTEVLRWSLALVLLVHLVAIAWPWYRYAKTSADPAQGETGEFLHQVILWTLPKAFITVVLTLGPVLLLSTCL